jgi:hypothetical protein
VSDVTSMKSITSELNFEIYRRFKDASLFDAPPPVMNINLPELEKRGFILREQVDRNSANGREALADEGEEFSSEVDKGSREENASKKKKQSPASDPIRSKKL